MLEANHEIMSELL